MPRLPPVSCHAYPNHLESTQHINSTNKLAHKPGNQHLLVGNPERSNAIRDFRISGLEISVKESHSACQNNLDEIAENAFEEFSRILAAMGVPKLIDGMDFLIICWNYILEMANLMFKY